MSVLSTLVGGAGTVLSTWGSYVRLGLILGLGALAVGLALTYRSAVDDAALARLQAAGATQEAAQDSAVADANRAALVEETAEYQRRLNAAEQQADRAVLRAATAARRQKEIKDAPLADDRPVGPLLNRWLNGLSDGAATSRPASDAR